MDFWKALCRLMHPRLFRGRIRIFLHWMTMWTRFEHYFATVIYLVFTLLGKYVHSEVHNSQGRADCVLETAAYVYIFEFKLDKSAQAALAQIEEKGYALPYTADKRKIYRIGVNFSSESRNIAAWEVCE